MRSDSPGTFGEGCPSTSAVLRYPYLIHAQYTRDAVLMTRDESTAQVLLARDPFAGGRADRRGDPMERQRRGAGRAR
jgi:hypothetical protein